MQPDFKINVLLDDIRSALNVGAIFRTCDATGVNQLLLSGITPYPPHNRIPKTALGAIDTVNWIQNKNKEELITSQKQAGQRIVSIELTPNAQNIYTYKFEPNTTVVFGNEISGVSQNILDQSDAVIYLPMFGQKESLNVATCCGIVLYEIIRQMKYN